MTTPNPITPPPELVQQWEEDWHHSKVRHIELEPYIAAQAAQWGADQELEACCKWLAVAWKSYAAVELRAARRPKPPSLKLQALNDLNAAYNEDAIDDTTYCNIRRALEAMNDD